MSYSITSSESRSFTVVHARLIASKVATDLGRMRAFYGSPSESRIVDFEQELIALLKAGYLKKVTYGFKLDGKFIEPSLIYTADDLVGINGTDDDPGKIRPGANIDGATFYSFLCYSPAWQQLTQTQKEAFESDLAVQRSTANEPGINGYTVDDRTYSAGTKSLSRATVRSL
jgi:hypothetical protein